MHSKSDDRTCATGCGRGPCKTVWAVFLLCAAGAIGLPAQTFRTLHSFDLTDGASPHAALIQGTDGNFYGTTLWGGNNGATCTPLTGTTCGTIFKISPTGTLTTLYEFCAQSECPDGSYPVAALVQSTNGDFYGTTLLGGNSLYQGDGCGTIFTVTPGGALTTLYSFCAQNGEPDGDGPTGLIQAADGYFYGTTENGGSPCYVYDHSGCGTVFKMTPNGTKMTIYSFCTQSLNCPDGYYPNAGLIQATDGDLYGTTVAGGAVNRPCPGFPSFIGCGTVFKISPSGTLTTLHEFCSEAGCVDGAFPFAGVVQATDGDLYGTTIEGGANGKGTVYKISQDGEFNTLYSFCSRGGTNCTDGAGPQAGLVQATDGDLYGVTGGGGANSDGTIFEITPSGALTTIYNFCSLNGCADGDGPAAALIQGTNGNLYGTTVNGGLSSNCNPSQSYAGCGTVFSLSLGLPPFVETLPTFGAVGATVQILGTNLTGATTVTFNGIAAVFTVVSGTLITTTVPSGASTGEVQVTTPSGTLLSNVVFLVQAPAASFTVALSTAGQVEPFAAQSIVSAYGTNLATGTASASSLPLPTSLDGTTVTVTDSAGVARVAPLFYVSPPQINFEIPPSTATGTASVSIQSQGGGTQTANIQIGNVSPGLFELNGSGLVAAWVLPVISGIQQPLQPVYQVLSGAVVSLPINLGSSTEQIYLEMYGTGIRNANSVTAMVGSLSVPVLYAGAAPGFAGEDQVNIGPLPQSLAGAGSINIVLKAGGLAANTVNVTIQ